MYGIKCIATSVSDPDPMKTYIINFRDPDPLEGYRYQDLGPEIVKLLDLVHKKYYKFAVNQV